MSMMMSNGSQSIPYAEGMDAQPYQQMAYDPHMGAPATASQMQGQYPAGMDTYAGGAPPSEMGHGDMGMETRHAHAHPEINKTTGEAPRRCTDISCCFLFLLYIILMFTILIGALQHGDVRRLTRGTDYYGRICGVSPGVENQPWLFWCRTNAPSNDVPSSIDLDNPSCVATCPSALSPSQTDLNYTIVCLNSPPSAYSESIPGGQLNNLATQVIHMQESIIRSQPYPTTPQGGRFCIPQDVGLKEQVFSTFGQGLGPWSSLRIMTMLGTLGHLYWLLVITTLTSILFGYLYFYVMRHCPKTVARIFLTPAAGVALFFTVMFFLAIAVLFDFNCVNGGGSKDAGLSNCNEFSAWYIPKNPFYNRWDNFWGSVWSLVWSVLLGLLSALLIGMWINFSGESIADMINASFECMKAVPCIFLVPFLEAWLKFIVFWFGLQGIRVISSLGKLEKNRIVINGAKYAGLSRKYIPDMEELVVMLRKWDLEELGVGIRWWFYMAVWIFGIIWFMEICTSLGQFITAHGTFRWYTIVKDKGKKPAWTGPPPLIEGLKFAILYHFGSILRGSFLIAYTPLIWTGRFWRLCLWTLVEINPAHPAPTTACGRCIKLCKDFTCNCFGLADCCGLKKIAQKMVTSGDPPLACKDAYNDVIIRSNDYDGANEKAYNLLQHSHKIVQFLYLGKESPHIFKGKDETTLVVLGVTSISFFSAAVTYLFTANFSLYNNPGSSLYVAEPVFITILSGILAAYVAFGFMTTWEMTCDSLLYNYTWSRKWNRKAVDTMIPESLRYIVGFDDAEDDRFPYYGKAPNNMYLRSWLPMLGVDPAKKKTAVKDDSPPATATQPQGSWFSGFGGGGFGTNVAPAETQPLVA